MRSFWEDSYPRSWSSQCWAAQQASFGELAFLVFLSRLSRLRVEPDRESDTAHILLQCFYCFRLLFTKWHGFVFVCVFIPSFDSGIDFEMFDARTVQTRLNLSLICSYDQQHQRSQHQQQHHSRVDHHPNGHSPSSFSSSCCLYFALMIFITIISLCRVKPNPVYMCNEDGCMSNGKSSAQSDQDVLPFRLAWLSHHQCLNWFATQDPGVFGPGVASPQFGTSTFRNILCSHVAWVQKQLSFVGLFRKFS